VLVIYALGVVLAVLSLALSGRGQVWGFLLIVVAGGVTLYLITRRAQGALDRRSYAEEPETDLLADGRQAANRRGEP